MEIFDGTNVDKIICGRHFTVVKTTQDALTMVGIGNLAE